VFSSPAVGRSFYQSELAVSAILVLSRTQQIQQTTTMMTTTMTITTTTTMATMTGEWSLLFAKVSHSTGQALGAESISSAIAVDLKAYTYSS
jgi:hypothetical protein